MPSPCAFGTNAICSCAGPAVRCFTNSAISGWPSLSAASATFEVMSVSVIVSDDRPLVVVADSGACSSGTCDDGNKNDQCTAESQKHDSRMHAGKLRTRTL